MPPRPHRPAALAWQVFRGSEAVQRGLLTEHQLRSSAWVRVRHDVYADARLDRDHALACRAAALRLPGSVLMAGPSAAYLHGVEHAATFTDEVHVLVPQSRRVGSQQGIRLHVAGVGDPASASGPAVDPTSVPTSGGGCARTNPAQAAWETAVWVEPVRAVGIVDALLRQGLTTPSALAAEADLREGRPGGRRARWVFYLADPGAQSPPESHLRVRLVLAGLPRPVTQHPVRLPSGLVLHPDLAWPDFRVAVEYDGHWQQDRDRLHLDRQRLNQLVTAGWLVLHVTSRRLHRKFPKVAAEVRAALTSRGWRP
ncbi:endonuclease domain-containing protein [Micromonospora sp. H33]|uniref:endonuclease domain-containing protein n=1 Tax=Micromonospora sp. H33 TaxID=3452215 RepID=UPI003F89A469